MAIMKAPPGMKRLYFGRERKKVDLYPCGCGLYSDGMRIRKEKDGYFWIECDKCGSFTELHETLEGAVKEWNRDCRRDAKTVSTKNAAAT